LEEAVEKLKNGESIGATTKAAMKNDINESKTNVETTVTVADNIEVDNEAQSAKLEKDEHLSDSILTVMPIERRDSAISLSSRIPPESECGSEVSDTFSVLDTADTMSSINGNADLTEVNLHEVKELRSILLSKLHLASEAGVPMDKSLSQLSETSDVAPESVDPEQVEVVFPAPVETEVEGWEMLQLVIDWIRNEFKADQEALARQLANNEISHRFLWLYFVPGSLISFEDPASKQQLAARVFQRFILSDARLK
jgi:hypothetical protein